MTESNWRPVEHFPDLRNARRIAVDVETYDPLLMTKGPGTIRKDGYIIGFSVAAEGFKGYYPLRHLGDNMPNPQKAINWLRDQMENEVPKVGANILYDIEWMKADLDIDVGGPKYDVQIADPLIDENWTSYRLDLLAERYLGLHKDEVLLYEAGKEILGLKSGKEGDDEKKKDIIHKAKGQLHQIPSRYVGPYGEADAILPIQIFEKQEKILQDEGLWDVFLLECEVLEMLLAMRRQGVPVDVFKAEEIRDMLRLEYDEAMRNIKRRVDFDVDIWSADSIVKVCDTLGLTYLKTEKGNASFKADWLEMEQRTHPIFGLILEARKLDRSGSVFIDSKILDMEVGGYVYPSFWQVKTDRAGQMSGTASGRFSSSNPNAQQFPARDKRLAKLVRSILVAEEGCQWACFDWSQQEPRLTVHYACLLGLQGAQQAKEEYISNPDMDYHQMVSNWTGIERKTAKNINLGLAYGMGVKKYSEMYNKTVAEAKELYALYHAKLPYVKQLTKRCENSVKQRGHIRTLLNRHCHFNLYGPPKWTAGQRPMRKEEAIKEYGLPVTQYFTYRAMNRLIQGSAADMMKKAMVDCFRAGYIPNLTVHDELDFATIENEKQISEIREIMLNCVKLEVPLKLDVETGPNWGELDEIL